MTSTTEPMSAPNAGNLARGRRRGDLLISDELRCALNELADSLGPVDQLLFANNKIQTTFSHVAVEARPQHALRHRWAVTEAASAFTSAGRQLVEGVFLQ